MKKSYNQMTTNDMPVDSSFTPKVERTVEKTPAKPKITARGTQKGASQPANNKTNSSKGKATTAKTQSSKAKSDAAKSKVSEGLSDLEQLNDENIKSYRFKSRRNRVVIITLVVLLVITIAAIAVFMVVSRLETNCSFHAHGADASFVIDGEEMSRFRAPGNLQGNARLEIDVDLKIEEAGMYEIKFVALCYQKGELMENTLIYEKGDLFYEGALHNHENDPYYYSKQPIAGNQTIRLCGGVIFDYRYRDSLNINNFRMEFHVYLEKV